jgi:hypothetical protein
VPVELEQGFILFGRFIVVVERPSAPAMDEIAKLVGFVVPKTTHRALVAHIVLLISVQTGHP